ncbi:MAG: hypothetical protein KatS3mg015_2090 [Fimbriimonadales bacterium]|nr:MAG: hypothetical protein KatS3mg015_2090 [Fimbriimonadales bacterium]
MKTTTTTIALMLGMVAAFAPATTKAAIQYDFSILVTGDPPQGTSPFATLIVQDAGTDTVDMTLTHNAGSASGQFLTKLLLNIEPVSVGTQPDAQQLEDHRLWLRAGRVQ